MAISVNVRISGILEKHLKNQITDSGLYENASEYIRELIRKDFKEQENKKFKSTQDLDSYLAKLANTSKDEFITLDIDNSMENKEKELKEIDKKRKNNIYKYIIINA